MSATKIEWPPFPHPSPACCCLQCWHEWPSQNVQRPKRMEPFIRPFSNGSQFVDWQNRNCCRCAKYSFQSPTPLDEKDVCQIELALFKSGWGDGKVPNAIAERMGYFDANGQDGYSYTWPCREWNEVPR